MRVCVFDPNVLKIFLRLLLVFEMSISNVFKFLVRLLLVVCDLLIPNAFEGVPVGLLIMICKCDRKRRFLVSLLVTAYVLIPHVFKLPVRLLLVVCVFVPQRVQYSP